MAGNIKNTLQRLERYNNSPSPILSIYFLLPFPKNVTQKTLVNNVQTLLTKYLSVKERKLMHINLQYILGFMETYQQKSDERTLALFSGGDNFFEVLHLPYKIHSIVKLQHSPYLFPLNDAIERDYRYLVVLPDREKALVYTVYSGSLEETKTIFDDSVPKDTKGKWTNAPRAQRNDKIQRHIHDHLNRHFDFIVSEITKFIEGKSIKGIILGGHEKEMNQFEKHLPLSLQKKIKGSFLSDFKVNLNQIVNKSIATIKTIENNTQTQSIS